MQRDDVMRILGDSKAKYLYDRLLMVRIPDINGKMITPFSDAMKEVPDSASIADIHTALRDAYEVLTMEVKHSSPDYYYEAKKYFKLFSKTCVQLGLIEPNVNTEQMEQRRAEKAEKLQSIEFIRGVMDTNVKQAHRERDLLKMIATDSCLADELANAKDDIIKDPSVVYDICDQYAMGKVNAGEYKALICGIMKGVSYHLKHDPNYWLNSHGLCYEDFQGPKFKEKHASEISEENEL